MLSAAVLGIGLATATAVADPTETPEPTETTTETAPPPADPPATESTEPSAPPSSIIDEPATDEPSAEGPAAQSIRDIQMAAVFDKSSYHTGETMTITVTMTNAGTEPVTATADFFIFTHPDAIKIDYPTSFGPFTLAAGESHTQVITGAMGNPDVTTATLYAWAVDPTGDTQPFTFTVPVTQTFGHATGTVYVDANHNEGFDDGEGRGGITLTWSNTLHSESTVTVTTSEDGSFGIDKLTAGRYFLSGGGNGLTVAYQNVTVDESGVDLLIRAYEPLTDLSATMEFAKDSYGRDEAPTVHVTLTNSGDFALTGIVARCNRAGFNQSLTGHGPGWGALAYDGDGVTVAAHSTLRLDVTEPMPATAYDYGYVTVGCDFGHRNVEDLDHDPTASDQAAVPGQHGDLTGNVSNDDGAGVAGVRLVLVPEEDGACPVAETTTDAAGTFAFRQVPVGDYVLYLFPPAGWHAKYDNPTRTNVVGYREGRMTLTVAPGDAPAPTLPDCPAAGGGGTSPQPQGSPGPDSLAYTGASLVVPGIVGVLALLAGTGAVVLTRRRRTSA